MKKKIVVRIFGHMGGGEGGREGEFKGSNCIYYDFKALQGR